MINTLFPDAKELDFRNTHYKNVLDVLDGDIWCAICNVDIKKTIILNENILIHENFLSLCCNNCFGELLSKQNGCIFCSQKIQLKICGVCNSNMCQRCIDNYCLKSKKLNKLEDCLRCSTNKLWSQRSQAAAVLKCFSFELDQRLTLSGKESENKQNVRKFVINTANCGNNFSANNIHQIRVKYLYQLLNSKIRLAFDEYQKFNIQIQDVKQCVEHFTVLCEEVLKNTCGILLDFKWLFNEKTIESLDLKVKSILKNSILFKKNENSCNKTQKVSCTSFNDKALNHRKTPLIHHKSSNVLTSSSSVSLGKRNEKMKNQYLSSMLIDKEANPNTESNTKICSVSDGNASVPNIIFSRFAQKDNDNGIAKNIKKKLVNEAVNPNTKSSTKTYSASEEITRVPKIILTRFDDNDIDNMLNTEKKLSGERVNSNTEPSTKTYSACAQFGLVPKIILIKCDQKDIDSNKLNTEKKLVGEKVNSNTEPSTKIYCANEQFGLVPKIILTKCDQKYIDNNKLNTEKKLVGERVNSNTEPSTKIYCANQLFGLVPKIILTKCDQRDIDNNNKLNIEKKLVGERVNSNNEPSTKTSSTSEGIAIVPKIILTRITQTDYKKSKKYEEKLNSEQTSSNYKHLKKNNQKCSEKYVDSTPSKNIKKRKCQEDIYANKTFLKRKLRK